MDVFPPPSLSFVFLVASESRLRKPEGYCMEDEDKVGNRRVYHDMIVWAGTVPVLTREVSLGKARNGDS